MMKFGLAIITAMIIGLILSNISLLAQPKNEGLNNTPPPNKSPKKDDMWNEAAKRVMRVEELTKKAESGDAVAQIDLGIMLLRGNGIEKNEKQAVLWLRKAADQGQVQAIAVLGWMYYGGIGVEHDFTKAASWFRKAAEQGEVTAQNELAHMLSQGLGVERDYQQAAEWYLKAAMKGDSEAQYRLGLMYGGGFGVTSDPKQEIEWYRKAAEQGHTKAQVRLGLMYILGIGVESNDRQAASWFRKAAEQGYAEGQFSLGRMYYNGQGITQDYSLALDWYRKAAEQGHAEAQLNLGGMYAKGQGVIEDFTEAYKWLLLAGMGGEDVAQLKEYLQGKMTAGQIAEAQRLAKDFVPKKEGECGNETERPKDLKTTGTGFFIDSKGTILTANHVIEKAKTIRIMAGDKILDAKVVAADAGLDIAILKVEGQGFEWLPIAASAPVKAGEKIFTVGYPNYAIQGTEPKYTEGVVNSVTGAMNNPRLFQVSAQVQPGNSGGPLVTEAGQVIGVVVQRLSDLGMLEATGMVAQSVNYAVKSAFVLPLLEGVEGWTRPEGKAEKPDRSAIIERARKAAVMVMGY